MYNTALGSYSKKFQYCIVIDLDYTLVNIDTTAMLALQACGKMRRLLLKALSASLLRFIVPTLNKVLTRDIYKLILLRACIRCNRNSLKSVIDEVYREALRNLNLALVKAVSQVSGLKILLTASLDVIAKKFNTLGFNIVIGSVSECRDGKIWCSIDLYRKKHKILKVFLKYCDEITIIEDSPEPQYCMLNNVRVLRVAYCVR
jgi:hypothetical protein